MSLAQPSPVFSLKDCYFLQDLEESESVPVAVFFLLLTLQICFCFQESRYILISVSGEKVLCSIVCVLCVCRQQQGQ